MKQGVLIGTAIIAVASVPALAQEQLPSKLQTTDSSGTSISDIVVTAQKRAERLQDVPIAVSAMQGSTLKQLGISDPQSLGAVTPGLVINRVASAAIITLRGVGNQNAAQLGDEGATVLYVDGVYIPGSQAAVFKFNNIERTEVLKGPQGTLFGRNATGGVVQVITRAPSQETHADLEVGYGNYNTVTGDFYGTTGIASNLAANIAIHEERQLDGWGKNLFNGRDFFKGHDFGVRSKWVLDLSRTKITAEGDYNRSFDQAGTGYYNLPGSRSQDGLTIGPPGGFYDVSLNYPSQSTNTVYGGSLVVDQDLDFAHLVSISAYHKVRADNLLDQDGTSRRISDAGLFERERTFTQELQLISAKTSRINWVAGLYYYNDRGGYAPIDLEGSSFGGLSLYVNSFGYTKSYAAYAQATATLFTGTHLTLGGRYTDDRKHVIGEVDTNVPGLVLGAANQKAGFKKATFRVALDHKFTSDILGYVSFNRGFKSGGFNVITPSAPSFNPEVLDALEAGLKTEFFDHRVRVNLAVFHYKFSNLQLLKVVSGGSSTVNAASAVIKGVDGDMEARVTRAFTLRGGFSLLDSRFSRYPDAPFNEPDPAGGNMTVVMDATGNRLPYAPRYSFNIGGSYTIPTTSGDFTGNINYSYNAHQYVNADNVVDQPAIKLLNGSLNWASSNKRLSAQLWGRNLTKTKYYIYIQEQEAGNTASPAAPRTYGATLGVHF